jgi:hypothetical protein
MRLFPDDTAAADAPAAAHKSPSLDDVIAETQGLLAAFRRLSPDEMYTATRNLRILSNVCEAWAQRKPAE